MYPFFIRLYDRLSEPFTIIDSNQPEAPQQPEQTNSWQDYEGGNVENPPQYETPYGGYIGGALGTLTGGITSGGNPAVAAGAGAAGFLLGNTIQNAIEGKGPIAQPIGSFGGGRKSLIPEPEPEPPPISFGGGRRNTVYVPSTM